MLVYYFGIKLAFFFGLVHSFVKFESLQRHWLFMSVLYTVGVAFLSWVFLIAPDQTADYRLWQIWLGKTLGLSAVYFWLLSRFDEGILFWLLLCAGVGLVLF